VPLSEEEQRLLEQMEEALAAEDPKFVSALRGASARTHHKRLTILAVCGFVIGIAVLMTGAVVAVTALAVAGFVVMLGSAYVALSHFRRMGEPDLPDNVHPMNRPKGSGSPARQSGFMNRMEDRWRRRRDDY
jgi:Flp pilus assembly protein TadB